MRTRCLLEGVVSGFPVSGLDIYALTRIQVHGPELWTGGAFGPEAGLIVLPALLVGAGLIYLYSKIEKVRADQNQKASRTFIHEALLITEN